MKYGGFIVVVVNIAIQVVFIRPQRVFLLGCEQHSDHKPVRSSSRLIAWFAWTAVQTYIPSCLSRPTFVILLHLLSARLWHQDINLNHAGRCFCTFKHAYDRLINRQSGIQNTVSTNAIVVFFYFNFKRFNKFPSNLAHQMWLLK